jgi:methyl-accepting chemotaxis protein
MEGCFRFLLVVLVVIGAIYLFVQYNNSLQTEAAEKASRIARDEAERRQFVAQQEQLRGQIVGSNEESASVLEQMPVLLASAEEYLDRAENDFGDGAFAPFWDSVEKAAGALGGFEEGVRKIEQNSRRYVDLVKQYRGEAPSFAVSRNAAPRLGIASETSKRMSEIVRKAQRNFEFSLIYEQRKTNQLLVAGFKNLAQALEGMSWRITTSIDELRSSVDNMHTSLNESLSSIHEQTSRIAAAAEGHRADSTADAVSRNARERKALEMLDNIQRRRYPSLIHGGLR